MRISAILGNPLLQFFAAGAVIFAIYWASDRSASQPAGSITISLAEQKNLAALFEKTWRRPPTAAEFKGLIDARLREELLYREALALGLDEGDIVVRRRLVQKVEFIADDLAARVDPSEADLEAFLADNAANYAIEPRLTFRQIYLSEARRGERLMADAEALLGKLKSGADPEVLGDAIDLPRAMDKAPTSVIARSFGQDFADAIARLEPGDWAGPVRSAYGVHLVQVQAKDARRAPSLDEVRDKVERDWREARRQAARAAYLKRLKDKYAIAVERANEGGS